MSCVTAVADLANACDLELQTSGDPGISAFPEGDNIFNWVGTMIGPNDTVSSSPRLHNRFQTRDYWLTQFELDGRSMKGFSSS